MFMALIAAAVTYLLVPLVRRFAIRIGAAPEIRERDVHTTPTPRLGGLAMYGGLVAGLLVAGELTNTGAALADSEGDPVLALIVAGGVITVTGFLDDWWGMDPFIKLAGQIAAAVLVLPLIDLITAVVRRTSYGMSPFAPDRGHLHHRLMDIGHSHRQSVLIMYAWAFLFAFGIVAMSTIGVPVLLFPPMILLALGVLVMMAAPRWRRRVRAARDQAGDDDGPPTGPMPPIVPETEIRRRMPPESGPTQERASAEHKPVIPAFPSRP